MKPFAYFKGIRFKKVSWNWTAINLFFTWHGGRNPVSGHRFLYIGTGPFLGFDFYWPKERIEHPLETVLRDVKARYEEHDYLPPERN
jgi:hypothetical protein